MKTLYYIIIFVVVLSCGNRQVNSIKQAEIDSVKPMKRFEDFVEALRLSKQPQEQLYSNQQTYESLNVISDNDKVYDSYIKHNTDSLTQVVKYIKQHKKISINQRIKRIDQLYNSMVVIGSVWANSNLGICYYKLLTTEIGLLLTDTLITHYNIDSIFSSIDDNLVSHSDDNRLWAISILEMSGGTANSPINIIAWRDSNNIPKSYITSYSTKFKELEYLAYYDSIFKLTPNLYLLLGSSKGYGNNAIVVELSENGLNLKYKGFKEKNKRTIIYNIGIDRRKELNWENYKFDTLTKTLFFIKTSSSYYDSYSNILTNGKLIFNGKYFEEKLSKSKMKQKKD